MDLNHARLPIPPRWQLDSVAAAAFTATDQEEQHFYSTEVLPCVKREAAFLLESRRCAALLHDRFLKIAGKMPALQTTQAWRSL
jgi:hypothetical protein